MILDADDLKKVLGEVFSETMRKELFENHFRVQEKNIRYFPKMEDALAAMQKPENEGGLNEDERKWYYKPVMSHFEKLEKDKNEKRVKAGNRERLGPTPEDLEKDPQALEKWQKSETARMTPQKKGG